MLSKNKLKWFVYYEDINSRRIESKNIFELSIHFTNSLVKLNKNKNISFEEFSTEVDKALMYSFWSKSEYEIILTSWPPYVSNNEVIRLSAEREESLKKRDVFYCETVNLNVERKIDIYDQVKNNFDIFINYLWNNRDLIKYLGK